MSTHYGAYTSADRGNPYLHFPNDCLTFRFQLIFIAGLGQNQSSPVWSSKRLHAKVGSFTPAADYFNFAICCVTDHQELMIALLHYCVTPWRFPQKSS